MVHAAKQIFGVKTAKRKLQNLQKLQKYAPCHKRDINKFENKKCSCQFNFPQMQL